jgi:hypothetical protein
MDVNNAYYGRKWEIVYTPADGSPAMVLSSSDFGDYALRSTFKRDIPGYQAVSFCEVTIWNLNADTDNKILARGKGTLSLQAGYINGAYGNIFTGGVFQIIRGRESLTDYYLKFICIDGHGVMNNNIVSCTAANAINQRSAATNIANQATTPFQLITTPDIINQPLPRGKVFFGEPKKYLRQIARDNNAQLFALNDTVVISKLTDGSSGSITISPSTGLIGYPKQVDWGVSFECLLNPNLVVKYPAMSVKLDQTAIQQQLAQYGQPQMLLDKNGQYQVARVTHIGDTRGNEWYTQVLGVLNTGTLPAMMANAQQNPN